MVQKKQPRSILRITRLMCSAYEEETPQCEFCEKPMTVIEHEFCDICDECREKNELD